MKRLALVSKGVRHWQTLQSHHMSDVGKFYPRIFTTPTSVVIGCLVMVSVLRDTSISASYYIYFHAGNYTLERISLVASLPDGFLIHSLSLIYSHTSFALSRDYHETCVIDSQQNFSIFAHSGQASVQVD
jgi:hypothetical protein